MRGHDFILKVVSNVTVLRFTTEGIVSRIQVNRLTDAICELIDSGHTYLVLDFKYVHHASSPLLVMLMAVASKLQKKGGKLALSRTDTISELLSVSKMDDEFEIYPGPQEAVDQMRLTFCYLK